jgi:hypothetical protein
MNNIIFILLTAVITLSFSENNPILTDRQIQGRLNIVNGYSAECIMHEFYTITGWIQTEGEVGRNGIDGLFYKKKNGIIREVLVAESKWNKSKLGWSGKNKLVHQMSQEWILGTLNKLQKHKPLPEYSTIRKLVEHDQYRARLFKMSPIGDTQVQIHIYRIKNKGMKYFDTFMESTLRPITLGQPRNSFERGILESYNRCREEALERYIPALDKKSIGMLLGDNYLQKNDVKNILRKKVKVL